LQRIFPRKASKKAPKREPKQPKAKHGLGKGKKIIKRKRRGAKKAQKETFHKKESVLKREETMADPLLEEQSRTRKKKLQA